MYTVMKGKLPAMIFGLALNNELSQALSVERHCSLSALNGESSSKHNLRKIND
jgi:hypothetical protein